MTDAVSKYNADALTIEAEVTEQEAQAVLDEAEAERHRVKDHIEEI